MCHIYLLVCNQQNWTVALWCNLLGSWVALTQSLNLSEMVWTLPACPELTVAAAGHRVWMPLGFWTYRLPSAIRLSWSMAIKHLFVLSVSGTFTWFAKARTDTWDRLAWEGSTYFSPSFWVFELRHSLCVRWASDSKQNSTETSDVSVVFSSFCSYGNRRFSQLLVREYLSF